MPKISKVNFTVSRVNEYKCEEGKQQAFLWDLGCPGLGIRATQRSRSYVFQAKLNGKAIRTTIGNVTSWTLPLAREEARRLQRLIDQGTDPRKEKAEQLAAEKQEGLLVRDVWTEYLKAHKDRWGERHYQDNEWHARAPAPEKEENGDGGILWPLLQKRLADIDANVLIRWAEDAIAIHEKKVKMVEEAVSTAEKKEKTATNRTADKRTGQGKSSNNKTVKRSNIRGRNAALRQGYLRFRALWNWAYQREEYAGAMADPRIFSHSDLKVLLPKVQPKNDVLEKGQLMAWFDAVRAIENPVISSYLQILLLCGARRNELSMLKWIDVDFQWGSLWLRDKVEAEGRKIPMTEYIRFLLKKLPEENEWCFSSKTSDSGRLVEPRLAHKRALSVAGLPDISLHGLRRSFATLSEWLEMPTGVVAQLMGHRASATAEKYYKRRPLDLLKVWHQKFEDWVLEEAGIHFNPDTVDGGLKLVK